MVDEVLRRISAEGGHHNAWIHVLPRERLLAYAQALQGLDRAQLPLYGVPFAIKDNIDLAGTPTTAACPGFAYTPEQSAPVVQRLIEAGAIPLGKTNLDQFATGLVGSRSPYGPGRNVFDPDYICGGSSSGSAISVALGQVSFALGTDTAGSGRVPAAFNNLVGLKPTRGLLSTRGVVPACRSLDCVSIFTLDAADAAQVLAVAGRYDRDDPYARPAPMESLPAFAENGLRVAIPKVEQLRFFGNLEAEALFARSVARLEEQGVTVMEVDFEPFLEAARLLYEGPWVAERYAAVGAMLERDPQALFPVTREIIAAANGVGAVEAFRGQYRLAELKRVADRVLEQADVMLTPTAGTLYTIEQVQEQPLTLNANLGYYTNFMNLLDYSAVALPAGFQSDGLPFGVTLFAPAFHDLALLTLADRMHRDLGTNLGATGLSLAGLPAPQPGRDGWLSVVVCGAHMAGLALNHQLTERGGRLLSRTQSAPQYRFYALAGGPPARPGMVWVAEGGRAIEVEVWELPASRFGTFVAGIPAPLGIGKVRLGDGSTLPGFICEANALGDATDITQLGGWRAYLEAQMAG